jgi:hypothetical protein
MNDAFAKFYAVKELKFLFVFCTILALSNTWTSAQNPLIYKTN